MKKPSALPIIAVLTFAAMQAASAQNLPASMAFPDSNTCGNLQFLDVSFPSLEAFPTVQSMAEHTHPAPATQPAIARSSAAALGAVSLVCMAFRKR
jgi:hypothetical protein